MFGRVAGRARRLVLLVLCVCTHVMCATVTCCKCGRCACVVLRLLRVLSLLVDECKGMHAHQEHACTRRDVMQAGRVLCCHTCRVLSRCSWLMVHQPSDTSAAFKVPLWQ